MQMLRGELEKHQNQTCEYRLSECQYCSLPIKNTLLEDHLKLCDGMLIKCSNDHCKMSFLRRNATQHENECEYAMVSCPLVRLGCQCHQILRIDLIQHQNDNLNNKHCELMMNEIIKLEMKCEKQAKAFSKQTEVCEVQRQRIEELVTENGQLMTTLCEKEDEITQLKQPSNNSTTKGFLIF